MLKPKKVRLCDVLNLIDETMRIELLVWHKDEHVFEGGYPETVIEKEYICDCWKELQKFQRCKVYRIDIDAAVEYYPVVVIGVDEEDGGDACP